MAYGLEPKRIFWWAHQEDGQTRLSWVTIRRVDYWHGRISFDLGGEPQEADFSELEVSLFRRYPLWDQEHECYLTDRQTGWEAPPKHSFRPAGQGSAGATSHRESRPGDQTRSHGEQRQYNRSQPEQTRQANRTGRVQNSANQERDPGQVQLKSGMRLWYLSEDRKSCSMITVQQVLPESQEMIVVTGGNTMKLDMSAIEKRISVGCPHKENNGLYVPDRTYTFTLADRMMKGKTHN